jgi:hypothetical protein
VAVSWVVDWRQFTSHQSTRLFNPESSHLCTHRRENVKSYKGCGKGRLEKEEFVRVIIRMDSENDE